MDNQCNKETVVKRLRRVEGQVKGIQRMVEEGKGCSDILIQVAAARAALNKVGGIIIENHMKECLRNYVKDGDSDEALDLLIDTMIKYTK